MVGANRELMACHFCNCQMLTSITQAQYLNHIQVKHSTVTEADVRSALLGLEQRKKVNQHLFQVPTSPRQAGEGFSEPKRTTDENDLEAPELSGGPSARTAIKTVVEKISLAKTIQQYQDMGRYAVQFHAERNQPVQRQLFRNLIHLAHMPNADQNFPLSLGQTLPPGFGMPGVVIREVSDEIVPEESREEVFTCTASRSRLPASEREKSMKMKWEDISDADDKNTRCRGQIVSKKRGEKDTGLLSGRSERESEETSAATEAIERRNAVARIANIDGRVAVVRKKHVSGIKVVANKETSRSKRKATGNKCGEQKPKFNWKVEGGKLEVCSACEFKGVLESKVFKEHLLKHYVNDLREEFAEALIKKECPFSDNFKSDSRDGSHCNHAMLRHIGVTHGEVIKYHLEKKI